MTITSVSKSSTISSSAAFLFSITSGTTPIITTTQHFSFISSKHTLTIDTVTLSVAVPFLTTSDIPTVDPNRPPSTLSKTSSTPIIVVQGQDSGENNPVIIIAAVIVPILLLLLIVGIIVTSCLIVYHQRQKKRKSNLTNIDDSNPGHLSNPTYQSLTPNQTSTNVSKVPCDNISNPLYGGNIISIISIQ